MLVCANVEKKDRISTLGKRAPDGVYEIIVTGEVGGWGDTYAEYALATLKEVQPKKVRFTIYSPGGYITDAIVIAGWLQSNGVECYAEIYGYCASAATVFMALAGPERTEIAPGSMVMVHLPYGGDAKSVSNATQYLAGLYAKAYGWTEEKALEYMSVSDGAGTTWTAIEAQELGMGTVMETAKVAAHHKRSISGKEPDTMKENKITAKVKLSTMEAIRAAVGEGATVEVEVDEAVAATIAEKEARIAELSKELNALKAAQGDAATATAAVEAAKAEAVTAKAELANATEAHTKAIEDLKAAHDKAIADLKKPLANATVPDNTEPKADPKTVDPAVKAVASMLKNMSPMDRAKMEVAARRREKATAK